MNNIQQKLLILMEEFDVICKEHCIEYFYAGGTALGGVRNGGFLPWDDDADVLIKRSEFEKLDRVMSEMTFKNRSWTTENNNRTYLNPTARYFDLESTDILESRLDYGAPKGCQVEVFIMDPFPNTKEEQIDFIQHLWLYSEISNNYILFGSLYMPAEMINPELFYYYKEKLKTESVESVKEEILKRITYKEEDCDYWCGRWSCMPYVFKKEWMASQKYVDFEGHSFPVPIGVFYEMIENYDSYWDMIPKPKERKIHPSIKSSTVSYRKFEPQIREWCDEVNYNQLLYDNKADRVERLFAWFAVEKDFSEIRKAYLDEIAKRLNSKSWSFDHKVIKKLNSEFKEYFGTQFRYSYYKFKHSVHLNEDLLETMILTLIHSDKVERAKIMVDLHPEFSRSKEYCDICESLSELKIKKYEENTAAVKQLLDSLSQYAQIIGQHETERAYLWYISQTEKPDKDEIKKIYSNCRHQEDMEIKKYVGDLYDHIGQHETANRYYRQVLKKSRNGMILYDLKKRGIDHENHI